MSTAPTARSGRTVVIAAMSSVIGAVPSFLVGAMAVFLREDLAFNRAELGIAIAMFFLASAVAAIPGGQVTERAGARVTMLAAASTSGIAMLGIALLARSWTGLVLWLAVAGLANGVAQPAGNLALSRGVARGKQGFAFGVKQSAIPASTLLAGLAVPVVALTVGWRWSFVAAAGAVVLLAVLMPKDAYRSPVTDRKGAANQPDMPLSGLLLLAFAAACGASVGTSLGSFYVEGAVTAGFGAGYSGVMLAVGSLSCIASRLLIGLLADRWVRGHIAMMVGILLLGGVGLVGLALTARFPVLLVPATLLAFAAGWGWPGIFNYTVARRNPSAPAAATAITQTGVFVGGVSGPAAFGAIAESVSFAAAWTTAAALCVAAAVTILASRRFIGSGATAAKPGEGADQHDGPEGRAVRPTVLPEDASQEEAPVDQRPTRMKEDDVSP